VVAAPFTPGPPRLQKWFGMFLVLREHIYDGPFYSRPLSPYVGKRTSYPTLWAVLHFVRQSSAVLPQWWLNHPPLVPSMAQCTALVCIRTFTPRHHVKSPNPVHGYGGPYRLDGHWLRRTGSGEQPPRSLGLRQAANLGNTRLCQARRGIQLLTLALYGEVRHRSWKWNHLHGMVGNSTLPTTSSFRETT